MADDNHSNQEEAKMYNNDEVQEMIKKRLKNKSLENEELKAELERLQGQMNAPTTAAMENNPSMENESAMSSEDQTGSNPANMNADEIQRAVQEGMEKNFQNHQLAQDQDQYINNVQRMHNEDDKFKKALEQFNEEKKQVPLEVGVHLNKSLTPDQTKKALMKIMNNDLTYYRMKDAYNEALRGNQGPYQQWLNGLLMDNKAQDTNSPEVMPDLTESNVPTGGTRNQNALDYLKRQY